MSDVIEVLAGIRAGGAPGIPGTKIQKNMRVQERTVNAPLSNYPGHNKGFISILTTASHDEQTGPAQDIVRQKKPSSKSSGAREVVDHQRNLAAAPAIVKTVFLDASTPESVGHALECARIQAGVSRAEMSRRTGRDPSNIRRHETGEGGFPRADILKVYGDALGIRFVVG